MLRLREYLPLWAHEWIDVIVPGLQIVGILVVAWLLQYLLRRLVSRVGLRYQLPTDLVAPVRNMLRYLIYGAAFLLVMERLGVSATVLWTGFTGFVTVAAVAFFAAWSVLSNLFCAVLIFSTRPFRLGDVVELIDSGDKPGIKGRVIDIQLVYTTLEDVTAEHAGALLQVPNALFFQKSLRRWRTDPGTLSL
ncbi:mechanosensitive ion channel family protein [Pseudorhodoferax sp. Leaf265]|uniref:mechanosensitive ion channel family protein n=1 Tax=Pseudorhodoferax sp. Leaf265 TaxID=1736315 RepID=UPI0006FF4421|nr:mechanosensitive ion channel family protein [Pseudorhodoferax sp. Leaf265]KQP03046.1 mechanosensitive ion channel protein MscS [Pseudorhodoferax sp. Leaf265]PZP93509.1 MAG: mechanosensitive ion channel family protein [Variovorax paradoxus]PZQ04075.1 MAG: mechanosensitive ion channel family protein [Variovorax paradoxus]